MTFIGSAAEVLATVLTIIGLGLVAMLALAYAQERKAIRQRQRRLQHIDWQAQQAMRRIWAHYDGAVSDVISHSVRRRGGTDPRRPRGRS